MVIARNTREIQKTEVFMGSYFKPMLLALVVFVAIIFIFTGMLAVIAG